MESSNLRSFPPEYGFLADVLAEIAKDKYEVSLTLFLEGMKQLVVYPVSTTEEDFEYAFATLEVLLKFKLQQKAPKSEKPEILECNFCGKQESNVERLIAGAEANICDNCVQICNQILTAGKAQCSI